MKYYSSFVVHFRSSWSLPTASCQHDGHLATTVVIMVNIIVILSHRGQTYFSFTDLGEFEQTNAVKMAGYIMFIWLFSQPVDDFCIVPIYSICISILRFSYLIITFSIVISPSIIITFSLIITFYHVLCVDFRILL